LHLDFRGGIGENHTQVEISILFYFFDKKKVVISSQCKICLKKCKLKTLNKIEYVISYKLTLLDAICVSPIVFFISKIMVIIIKNKDGLTPVQLMVSFKLSSRKSLRLQYLAVVGKQSCP